VAQELEIAGVAGTKRIGAVYRLAGAKQRVEYLPPNVLTRERRYDASFEPIRNRSDFRFSRHVFQPSMTNWGDIQHAVSHREPVDRANPLVPATPAISSLEPPRLKVGGTFRYACS